MTVFRQSEWTSYDINGISDPWPCEVRIDSGTIVVSYHDGENHVVYRGSEVEPGHFKLTCPEKRARASLHRFADDPLILDGFWSEEGYSGMWRIQLDDSDLAI